MKKYTLADFNDFEVAKNGDKICPSGDYSLIREFPSKCSFGAYSSFGGYCGFGERCSFGESSNFGEGCIFGAFSKFGVRSNFGENSRFGESSSFGENGMYCLFEFNKLINLNGIYNFPIRIYLNTKEKEYYLSIGCMNFATLEEARVESKNRKENNNDIIDIVKRIINKELGGK